MLEMKCGSPSRMPHEVALGESLGGECIRPWGRVHGLVGGPPESEAVMPCLPHPGEAVTVPVGGSHGQHHTALSNPWMASIRITAAGSICHFSASLRISSAAGPALITTLARRSLWSALGFRRSVFLTPPSQPSTLSTWPCAASPPPVPPLPPHVPAPGIRPSVRHGWPFGRLVPLGVGFGGGSRRGAPKGRADGQKLFGECFSVAFRAVVGAGRQFSTVPVVRWTSAIRALR